MKVLDPQKHQQQMLRILQEARRLFSQKGVKETSMSLIARACRLTKATLYHYFPSKEAILHGIFELRWEQDERLIQALRGAQSLEECLYLTAKGFLEQMKREENVEFTKILLSESLKNNYLKKIYMGNIQDRVDQNIKQVLGPFLGGRLTPNAMKLVAFQFVGAIMNYTMDEKILGGCMQFEGGDEEYIRSLSRVFAQGLEKI
ncbi:MAG TPA: helix-turn-helix domain-containing protein [bacterium]|nr:helix-turn-helix domain-containing protein [bacterium]